MKQKEFFLSCIQSALADEEPADGAGQEAAAVQEEPQEKNG